MRVLRILMLSVLFGLATTAAARAQGVHVTPLIGGYIQASDFETLKGEVDEARLSRDATMALGVNLELGSIRGTLMYVTGAELTQEGILGREKVGDGSILAIAGDFVIRPIPRILGLQPYALIGAGLKRNSYSFDDSGFGIDFPKNERDFAGHIGFGADFMLGGLGVTAEFSDFVTYKDGSFGPHDAFASVGVRLRLF